MAEKQFDPSNEEPINEWRERFATVLCPYVSRDRLYAAADAVLAMPEWASGIVFGDDMDEHRHPQYGQGYFSTPDATLFLNEQVGRLATLTHDGGM